MRDLGTWKLKGIAESVHVYDVESAPASAARSLGPALRIPAVLLPPPLRGAAGLLMCPDLVQRDESMAALTTHLADTARGDSRFVALTGEAGVGKSRLVRELARVANEEGFYVFGGRSHRSAATPYEPFVAALRPYAQARGGEILQRVFGPLIVELRRLLPELDIAAPPSAALVPEEERRERFQRAIHLLLEDAATQRPVLLVLEDMHEADIASLDLLRYLTTSLHGGVYVVFTYREEDVGPTHPLRALVAELDRERRLGHVRVEPLDLAGVAGMTRALLPERASDELAAAVFARSEGVPFYVEELLKTAIDDPQARHDRLPLPRTVRDSVQMRVARLAEERGHEVADLLEAAAVAGIPLRLDVLERIAGRDAVRVGDDLAACVEAQLLERPPTTDEIYQFRHTLTRDAIEAAIPLSRRKRLHARVAAAIEAMGPSAQRAPMLAYQFAAAGEPAKAVRYAREAARAATTVGAFGSAIDLLTTAAVHANGAADEPAVLEELASAHAAAGRASEAEAALLRARDLVRKPVDIARIDVRMAGVLRMQGHRGEAIAAVRRAIETFERENAAGLDEALVVLANLQWAEGAAGEAVTQARHALETAERHRSEPAAVAALTVLGASRALAAHDEGARTLREAIARARRGGLEDEAVNAYYELARAERRVGSWEAAGAAGREGLALARQRGLEFAQARLLAQLGHIYFSQGRLNDAREVAEQSVALARPGTIAATNAITTLADVLSQQGDHRGALALLDQVAPQMEHADPDLRAAYLAERARPLLGLGRLDEAAASVRRGVEMHLASTPGAGITTFLVAAEVAEARRDAADARWLVEEAGAHFAKLQSPTVRVLRHELAAVLDRCEGRDAARSFAAVADEYDELGVPLRALYRRATAAMERLAAGARTSRAELVRIGNDLRARGALRYASIVDAALRVRPSRAPAAAGPLSDRDLEVALLVSRGLTDAAIAARLDTTPARANAQVRAVLGRLGVARRSQVAGWVVQRLGAEMGSAPRAKRSPG
jgi:DNA-binding NarL/FixJ family response regulator